MFFYDSRTTQDVCKNVKAPHTPSTLRWHAVHDTKHFRHTHEKPTSIYRRQLTIL